MDVFASEPIAKQIHEMGIAQLMVHNVVGDLLRNAIRAITRDGRTDGKILVIVGKKNETVEIDIFDNGANLPLEVLERFGTRGVTTGGTGNTGGSSSPGARMNRHSDRMITGISKSSQNS